MAAPTRGNRYHAGAGPAGRLSDGDHLGSLVRFRRKHGPTPALTTTARSPSVGLIMTVITNPHFTEVVQGIEDELARNGYGLLLGDSHDDPERELRLLHDLHQRRVDGVILAPSGDAKLAFRYLRQQSIPTVLVDRMANPEFDQVGTENLESTALLFAHLANLGHRRIAIVAGLEGLATTTERLCGYRLGLGRSGLPFVRELAAAGDSMAEPARRAVAGLLGLASPPTALEVGNNYMTIGAMRALREAPLAIPDDVALVAFDDFEWADLFTPRTKGLTPELALTDRNLWL
jgi:LacI family transcriptional regulator, galactose operon repressor